MSKKFNIKKNKYENLIELLEKTDKRRVHDLYICSCYFSTEAIKRIVEKIENSIKIEKIFIYVDRRSALSQCDEDISRIKKWIESVPRFNFFVVKSDALFHTKAYAVISKDGDNVASGSLVVGSSNLTGNGLTETNGNIESLLDTQNIKIIEEFLDNIESIGKINLDDIDNFTSSRSINFIYALLRSGSFFHKWSENLGQLLSMRYDLSEEGRKKIANENLSVLGFNIDAASIGKRYFNFEHSPRHLIGLANLYKNFGIETHLGYWIPTSIVESLIRDDQDFSSFKEKINKSWENQKDDIKKAIEDDYSSLDNDGYIVPEESPFSTFANKIEKLIDNDKKLYRIYSIYEISDLPYDISQDDEIRDLHNEIQDLMSFRVRKNKAARAYMEAISLSSLEPIKKIKKEVDMKDD